MRNDTNVKTNNDTNVETKEKTIIIVTQQFYGNKVIVEIKERNLDNFVLGLIAEESEIGFDITKLFPKDRTIVKIPNCENLYLIYNKYTEERRIGDLMETESGRKHMENSFSAYIPELNLRLYSRCIICRIEDGVYKDITANDLPLFMKYLHD